MSNERKTPLGPLPLARHALAVMRHKWFVLVAGRRVRANLLDLLLHDMSKLGPFEAPRYARRFFGANDDPYGFAQAWNHHQNANPHHWEHWIPRSEHMRAGIRGTHPLPMPERRVREMVADWLGASRSYQGHWPESVRSWRWLAENHDKVRLHPESRATLDRVLREAFGEGLEALGA